MFRDTLNMNISVAGNVFIEVKVKERYLIHNTENTA